MLRCRVEILLIGGFLLHTLACSREPLGFSIDTAFKCIAISYLCYMAAFYYQDKKTIEVHKSEVLKQKKIRRAIIVFVASMYISNALDEFLFNPYEIKVSEYIGAIIAAVITIAQYNKWYDVVKYRLLPALSAKCKERLLQVYRKILNSWNH